MYFERQANSFFTAKGLEAKSAEAQRMQYFIEETEMDLEGSRRRTTSWRTIGEGQVEGAGSRGWRLRAGEVGKHGGGREGDRGGNMQCSLCSNEVSPEFCGGLAAHFRREKARAARASSSEEVLGFKEILAIGGGLDRLMVGEC